MTRNTSELGLSAKSVEEAAFAFGVGRGNSVLRDFKRNFGPPKGMIFFRKENEDKSSLVTEQLKSVKTFGVANLHSTTHVLLVLRVLVLAA